MKGLDGSDSPSNFSEQFPFLGMNICAVLPGTPPKSGLSFTHDGFIDGALLARHVICIMRHGIGNKELVS
jgi:hypothetical protein